MRACASGTSRRLRELLGEGSCARAANASAGSTASCTWRCGILTALRVLLEHGADPNARDAGDNASPLHFAAAQGNLESVRVLLDAGADVHGAGDLHDGDVIGWAAGKDNGPVIDLLIERGARHHIFSAMALGDRDLVERLVEEDPGLPDAPALAVRIRADARCTRRSHRRTGWGSWPARRTTRCWRC